MTNFNSVTIQSVMTTLEGGNVSPDEEGAEEEEDDEEEEDMGSTATNVGIYGSTTEEGGVSITGATRDTFNGPITPATTTSSTALSAVTTTDDAATAAATVSTLPGFKKKNRLRPSLDIGALFLNDNFAVQFPFDVNAGHFETLKT